MKALLSVAAVLAVTGSADAEIRIAVDPTAPFTERDLADAVRLRWTELPVGDVVVRVGRLGLDQLLVVVGDRSETVALPDRDRDEAARVVAVIVTSLAEGDRPPGEVVAAPAPAPTSTLPSVWSLVVSAGLAHESVKQFAPNGLDVTMVRGGIARTLAPNLRAIATVGYGKLEPDGTNMYGVPLEATSFIPLRLGIESTTGRFGVEGGGQMNWYSNEGCDPQYWGHSYSIYGAVKLAIPVTERLRIMLDVGGHYVVKPSSAIKDYCPRIGDFIQYGGSANLGLEWAMP